MKPNIADTQT